MQGLRGDIRVIMMKKIHRSWNDGTNAEMRAIWAASDGYGEPGYVPVQGYDWSGIRDSTDDAVRTMYRICIGL